MFKKSRENKMPLFRKEQLSLEEKTVITSALQDMQVNKLGIHMPSDFRNPD